jgi:hypothetical protein
VPPRTFSQMRASDKTLTFLRTWPNCSIDLHLGCAHMSRAELSGEGLNK